MIGDSRLARIAGRRPKSMPVSDAMPSAVPTAHTGIFAGSGVQVAIPVASTQPMSIPTAAPIAVKADASTRNCHRISLLVAPTAFRTPISLVLSVTLMSMIPITPTPPTSRPADESANMTKKKTAVS